MKTSRDCFCECNPGNFHYAHDLRDNAEFCQLCEKEIRGTRTEGCITCGGRVLNFEEGTKPNARCDRCRLAYSSKVGTVISLIGGIISLITLALLYASR